MHTSPLCKCLCTLLCVYLSFTATSQTNRYVDPTGSDTANDCSVMGSPCQTIAHAITQCSANDIINLAAGTYAESITINVDITLNGAMSGVVATDISRGTGESIINPGSNATAITVTSTGVTIDGVQIGASNSSSNATTGILDAGNNGITIDNNIIYANSTGITLSAISSGTIRVNNNVIEMLDLEDQTNLTNGSIGVLMSGLTGTVDAELVTNNVTGGSWGMFGYNVDNSSDRLLIDGGTFSGCTKGISINNADGGGGFAPSLATIQNVTMSGFTGPDADVSFPDAQAGIYSFISGSAANTDDITLTINNVDISGVGRTASDYSAIYMAGFASGGSGIDLDVTVTNSNIHDNLNRGIYIRGATTTANISQCTITGNGFNPTGAGGNPGFSIISRVSAVTTVSNCTITNAASQTFDVTAGLASDAATMTVTDCSITNNGNGSIATGLGGTLDLSRNWFGSTDESTINGLVATPAQVDFTPAIGSGTDTDGGTMGFQPDLSTLHVAATSGSQTGGTGRWQEGHDLANISGTVVLAHADYAETVTVTKSLTFQPTTSGTDTSLDNLVMNATAGTLTLSGNLLIDNAVTLTDGIIDVSSGTLRLGTSSSDLTETASSRVTGSVTLDPRAVGTGSIDRLGVNIATGTDDIGNVTIVRNSGTNAIITDGPHTSISASWDITVGAQPASGRDVTFTWRSEFDNGKDMTMISVFRFNGTDWVEISGPVDVSSSDPRSLTVNGVTQFSEWTMAQDDQPLPVELVGFKASKSQTFVQLSWSTMTEINSDHFEIQKSFDGVQFDAVSVIDAAGDSNEKLDYQWKDRSMGVSRIFYRLKIIDTDGTYEYSDIISIDPSFTSKLSVYPNPTSEVLMLNHSWPVFDYHIYDQTGRSVLSGSQSGQELDVSGLKNGVYFLRINAEAPIKFMIRD